MQNFTNPTSPTKTVNSFHRWMMMTIAAIFALFSSFNSFAQVFNTPGPGSFTVPAGVFSITVNVWGAGGGGGGGFNGCSAQGLGSGGAGGGFASSTFAVTPGEVYTYTVGAGGSGGAYNANGVAGGLSTFTGPAGTVTATGGGLGLNGGACGTVAGGAGGAGTVGTTLFNGANGGSGIHTGTSATGISGRGGGAAGSGGSAITPANTCAAVGTGGPGAFPGGTGGLTASCGSGIDAAGQPGAAPGGGGSGGQGWTSSTVAVGGAGAAGRIQVLLPCIAPIAQPTGLVLTPVASFQINGTFTAAGGSDSYLVVRYLTGAVPSQLPVDGNNYTPGSALGNGTVVSTNTTATFSAIGLAPSTTYDFYVYSMNSQCSGTLYLTAGALFGTAGTSAGAVATANGGLWNNAATWVNNAVPPAAETVIIPAGSIVTVDLVVTAAKIVLNGTLQWNSTANAMTINGDLEINAGGRFLPYTTGGTAVPINITGNYTNNGYANHSATASSGFTLNFAGATGSTISGAGTFEGDGTRGIIRSLAFQNTGSNVINTTQPLTINGTTGGANAFGHTAGSLNTNGKLKIDNTAQVHGQPINLQVASVAVTNMGSLYSVAPVAFGATVTQWSAINGVANTLYVSGSNVYRCVTGGVTIGPSAPTHTTGVAQNLLWIGTTGTLGNAHTIGIPAVGTQYFVGNKLYTCVLAGTANTAAGIDALTTLPGVQTAGGTSAFRYVGSPATVSVNYDGVTQSVRSLTLTSAGTGYSSAPSVAFSVGVLAGTGSGAAATAVYFQSAAGPTNSVTQKSGSATITGGITINSDQGTSIATVNPQASSGVGAVFTTAGGNNYTVAPQVAFGGPLALNLITNPGSGYPTPTNPTITVSGGTLASGGAAYTSASFTINVNQGQVESVYLTATAAAYIVPPTLTMSASPGVTATLEFPAGCWPAATANIGSNGQITSFTVTNAGFGYAAAPLVSLGNALSGAGTSGTFTTAATTPTSRVALYNLAIANFTPSPAPTVHSDDAAIPTSRKINSLSLAATAAGLNLTSGLTLFGTSPFTLTSSVQNGTGNVFNLGGNNLNFTWNGYAGANSTFNSAGAFAYITNGSMSVTGRGGASTFNFPFAGNTTTGGVVWFAGSTPTAVTTGSTVTRVTVTETIAPSGAGAVGTRSYLINNGGGIQGTSPTVRLDYNSIDALPGAGNVNELYVSQSTISTGPWTPRSASSGSGLIGTTVGQRTTATTGLGPWIPTGSDYLAWTLLKIDSANFTVPVALCVPDAHVINADFTVTTGTITGASLTYSNGSAGSPVAMTNSGGNTWTGIIPVATPGTALVTWSITVTSSSGLTRTFNGASYSDNPLSAATAAIVGNPNPVCAGSPSVLTATITGAGAPITSYVWNDGATDFATTSVNTTTVTPTVNTTYTVTAFTAAGCSVTSPGYAVTATPLPAAPFTGPSVQCGTGIPACFAVGTSNGNYRWYTVASGGTAIPGEVNDVLGTTSISVTTTFYVAIWDGTCESLRTPVVASVNTPDALSASSDGPVCANSPLALTATVTSNANGNVYTYTWSASPSAGSGIPTTVPGGTGTFGTPATTNITPTAAGSYSYTVNAVDATLGCATSAIVSVTVRPQPVIDSIKANPAAICEGLSSSVSVYAAGYITGPQTAPSGYCAATFGFTSEDDIGQVTFAGINNPAVRPTPQQSNTALAVNLYTDFTAVPPANVFAGSTYPFTLYHFHSTTDVSANFANVYIDFNRDGDFDDIGETFALSKPGATFLEDFVGSITIPVTASAGLTRMRVVLREGAITTPCNTGSWGEAEDYLVNITGVTAQNPAFNYSWTPGGATTPTISVNPSITTTYTATVTNPDPLNGCSSNASVTLTINPLPPAPSATNGTDQCGTGVTDASVSSNNTNDPQVPAYFNWYTVPTGGTPIVGNNGTTFTSPISATTTWYVSEVSLYGCEGPRVTVSTIVADPDPLTVTSTSITVCTGASFDISSSYTPDFNSFATFDLTATGGAASGVTGTVSLTPNATGSDPYTVTPSAPGVYIYTVTAFDPDKGCTSIGTVTVTVNPIPATPAYVDGLPGTICAGQTATLTAINGPQTAPSGYAASGATDIDDEDLGNLTFGSLNNTSTCALTGGAGSTLNLYSNYTGLTPTNVSQGQSVSFSISSITCLGNWGNRFAIFIDYNRDGDFDDLGENAYASAAAVTGPHTETGTIVIPVTATIGVTMMRAIVVETSGTISPTGTYSWGETEDYLVNIQATLDPSYTITWNPGALTGASVTVTPASTTTYTATASALGCSSAPSAGVTITVNPVPTAPSTNTPVSRCGPGTVTLTATGSGGTLNWYSVPTGGTTLTPGGSASYSPTVATGITTFYVDETSLGCTGPRSAVVVTATTPPTLAITPSGSTTFCQGGSVNLDAATPSDPSYINFTWSALPAVGAGLSSTSIPAITVAPTVSGTYTITVTADDGVSGPAGCSNTASVVVTANPNPIVPVPTATPSTVCLSGSSTLNSGTYIAGTLATPTLGGNGASGNAFNITATSTVTITSVTMGISSGSLAEVWYIPGGYGCTSTLTSSAGWTLLTPPGGSAITAAGGTPAQTNIPLTSTVTIPAGQTYGFVVVCNGSNYYTNGTTLCATLASDANISISEGIGGAGMNGAFSFSNSVRNFNGTIGYSFGDPNLTFDWNPATYLNSDAVPEPVSTPAVTTAYNVTVTNAFGCSSTSVTAATVTVTNVGANATALPATAVCAGSAVTLDAGASGGGPFLYSWASTPAGTYTATASISVNPTVTTTYTVTVTDACSNTITSSVTVNVNPLPTASIQETGPISVCFPGTQVLTAVTDAGSATYQWIRNGVDIPSATGATYTVSGLSTGSYSVRITNTATSCVNTSATVSVSINPIPNAVTITPASPSICLGGNQLLTASGGITGGSGNATIGTGLTLTGTTSQPTAFCNRWPSYRMQTLFTATELATAGITAGSNINSMAFTITSNGDGTTNPNFTVKIGASALTVMSGAFVSTASGFTTVHPAATYTHAVGVNVIPFSTPFTWDGSSNIIVEVMHDGADALLNSETYYTATGTNMVAYTTTNASNSASFSTQRLNVTFGYSSLQNPTWSWSPPAGLSSTTGSAVTASPAVTTTYTATATNSFGCTSEGTVTVNVVQPFVSAQPGAVTGITNVCPFIGLASPAGNLTYTVPQGPVGTVYSWIIPPTCTLVSGAGTNSIVITVGTGFIASANKLIRVRATEPCGSISAERLFYLLGQFPNTPAPITGPASACPFIGTGTATYSIPAAPGASSYVWAVPANATIVSGQGTTSITVSFSSGYATGAVTVQSTNDCGVSGLRSLTVTRTNPSTPSLISGPTNACEFIAPGGTPATYTVPSVVGVTYTWSVPPGAIGLTGQGTNSISFTYGTGFTSGVVSVIASNGCGTSGTRSLSISKLNPATPSVIDVVNTAVCPNRVYTYSLAGLPANATSVLWVVPTGQGAVLVSGQGTTSITVSYPATAIDGVVTAQAVNNCAVSVIRSTIVKLAACPVEPPPPPFTGGGNNNSLGKGEVAPVPVDMMSVNVYPNPTTTDFKLQVITAGKEEISVRVLDMQGRFFKQVTVMPYQTINIGAELRAGAYMIEVRQGKSVKTTRVLKF